MNYKFIMKRPVVRDDELYHYGRSIKDGAPGVGTGNWRRDPTNRVFISGSSKTTDQTSEWYRKELPTSVKRKINSYIKKNKRIVVGDAPGIDSQVQDYLKNKKYKNVEVYSPGTEARYLADKSWENIKVDNPNAEKGSKEWLAAKDIAMRENSNEALAIVIPGGASATRRNVYDFIEKNKNVTVYELDKKSDRKVDIDELINEYKNVVLK